MAQGYGHLISAISAINAQIVTRVATVANQALVLRNWIVGAYMIEFEQDGADRAAYGAKLMGFPIERLIVGSNKNDILTRFFRDDDMSLKGVEPSLSPSMYAQLAWATLAGGVVFGEWPDGLGLVGIGVIATAGVMIALDARRSHARSRGAFSGDRTL